MDYGRQITIRQCLSHTSGLPDCYSDGVRDSNGYSPFDLELKRNPERFWTSPEVIAWTKANLQPVARPGVRFHYSDTGYQLLGLVIESVRKQPLDVAVREVVLEPLKMDDTYAHHREKIHRSAGVGLSHFFDRESDNTEALSESADWGGGGWVTNAPDLTRFLRALSEGRLFRQPATWRLMQQWSPESDDTYGLALERFVSPGKDELVGHGGYFGSFAAIWPKADMVIVATINQSRPSATNGHTEVVGELVGKVCAAFHSQTAADSKGRREER
jgi:D-alanyl-D-alanine carboxypeptidase